MKEVINELNKKLEEYTEKWKNIDNAIEALSKINDESFSETKRTTLVFLRLEEKKFSDKCQQVRDAISAFQQVCEHKLSDGSSAFCGSGHDSHYSYETCKICGYEVKC